MAKQVYIYTPFETKEDWKNQRYMNSGCTSTRDPYQIWNSLSCTPSGLNQDSKESWDIKVAWGQRDFFNKKKYFILRNNADSKTICQSLLVVMVIAAACYSYMLAAFLSDLTQWK